MESVYCVLSFRRPNIVYMSAFGILIHYSAFFIMSSTCAVKVLGVM